MPQPHTDNSQPIANLIQQPPAQSALPPPATDTSIQRNLADNNEFSLLKDLNLNNGAISFVDPNFNLSLLSNGAVNGSPLGHCSEFYSWGGAGGNAFDGNPGTRWLSYLGTGSPTPYGCYMGEFQYISVTLAQPNSYFDRVRLNMLQGYHATKFGIYTCSGTSAECSAHAAYSSVGDVEGNALADFTLQLSKPAKATYMIIRVYNAYQNNRAGIYEVETMKSSATGLIDFKTVDAGKSVKWKTAVLNSTLTENQTLTLFTRTGDTAVADASWSEWQAVTDTNISSASGRYLEYRIQVDAKKFSEPLSLSTIKFLFE